MKKRQKNHDIGLYLLAILVALGVIGLFDHYLISLYQGQILLFVIIGLAGRYIMQENH